jgi:GntR family transcriptional regulator
VYTVYTVNEQFGGALVEIIISNASDKPIYEQIYTQIKNRIISGELNEGDALPSIRALAKDLRISVITTKRAYDELEHDGFIYTVSAKGCYVAQKNTEIMREGQLRQIEQHMREIMSLAPACRLSDEDIIEMLRIMQQEGNEQ